MKLADLKNRDTGLKKVASWLDFIGEHDEQCREEVFAHCKADPDAMAYYVGRWETRSNLDKRPIPLTVPRHEPFIDGKSKGAGQ